MNLRKTIWVVFAGLILFSGCTGKTSVSLLTGNITEDLQSDDPAIRIAAIHRAGQEKITKAVPFLIDRLSDNEQEVRMFAIVSLEKITGKRMGYEHFAPIDKRSEAIEKWRKWQTENVGKW